MSDAQPCPTDGAEAPRHPGTGVGDGAEAGAASGAVVAVRAGRVRHQRWSGKDFSTAATKEEVHGPVVATATGLAGDEQGDRRHHGGPDKALLAYARENYEAWHAEGRQVPEGGFFENLTVTGWPETRVHAGDVFAIGEVLVQVSQPRRPCVTLSARWGMPELVALVQRTGRSGYYLRVLREGLVRAGDAMSLVRRLEGSVSVAEIHRVMNVDREDREGIARVLASPVLPDAWRAQLQRRLDGPLDDGAPLDAD